MPTPPAWACLPDCDCLLALFRLNGVPGTGSQLQHSLIHTVGRSSGSGNGSGTRQEQEQEQGQGQSLQMGHSARLAPSPSGTMYYLL